ncbi:hypothetical protein COB57_00100 [Candidatus Peregrinibacteria bacterium]|nr:MAG: hypothetical protein COB57_00100 [Candidatus Peregrinibacteria bacterium]
MRLYVAFFVMIILTNVIFSVELLLLWMERHSFTILSGKLYLYFIFKIMINTLKATNIDSQELNNDQDIFVDIEKTRADAKEISTVISKEDLEVAIDTVWKNGMDLQNLEPRFQACPEVVLEAVKNDRMAIQFAAISVFLDTKFVNTLVDRDHIGCIVAGIEFIPKEILQSNKDLILSLFSADVDVTELQEVIGEFSLEIRNDKNFALSFFSHIDNGACLKMFKGDLQEDFDILKAVILSYPAALKTMPVNQLSKELIMAVLDQDNIFMDLSRHYYLDSKVISHLFGDKEVIMRLIESDPEVVLEVTGDLKSDTSLNLQALLQKKKTKGLDSVSALFALMSTDVQEALEFAVCAIDACGSYSTVAEIELKIKEMKQASGELKNADKERLADISSTSEGKEWLTEKTKWIIEE